jgi:hypothetical protein
MMLYAQRPARRTRQVVGDLAVLAWIAVWVWVARSLHEQVSRLGAPGRSLEDAGRGFAGSLDSAGERVGDVPFAGDALRTPFRAAGDAGRSLERAGAAQQDAVGELALWLSLIVAGLPIGYVLVRWATARVRWSLRATAAARLLDTSTADLELFALRALARQPVSRLRSLGPDLAGAWRRGDPDAVRALAQLELEDLGLEVRRLTTARAGA